MTLFLGFINGTLNATCRLVADQKEFYFGYKQKHRYKYHFVIISDDLISSLMGSYFMVEEIKRWWNLQI